MGYPPSRGRGHGGYTCAQSAGIGPGGAAGRGLAGRPADRQPGSPAARTADTSKITLVKGYGCGIYYHHDWHD
jgi:hypothetical protein